MGLLISLIIGLFVGLLARLIYPGPNPHGLIVTSLIGIAGAVVATYLGQAMGMYLPGEPAGFLASVLGAVLLLAVFSMFNRKRA